MEIRRGSVYWIDLNPAKGSEIKKIRPCVTLGIDPINRARRTIVVIPLSTSGPEISPLVINVKCKNKNAFAVIDQIRAVDKSRFKKKMVDLSIEDIQNIEDGVRTVLGL